MHVHGTVSLIEAPMQNQIPRVHVSDDILMSSPPAPVPSTEDSCDIEEELPRVNEHGPGFDNGGTGTGTSGGSLDDYRLMGLALEIAEQALERGEVPVGCLLVKLVEIDDEVVETDANVDPDAVSEPDSRKKKDKKKRYRILGVGSNRCNELRNGSLHAELIAYRDALYTANRDAVEVSFGPDGQDIHYHSPLADDPRLSVDVDNNHPVDGSRLSFKLTSLFSSKYVTTPENVLELDTRGTRDGMNVVSYDVCDGATLYVTCEPCIMCADAMLRVGVTKVVYGCSNPRFGGCGTVKDICHGGGGGYGVFKDGVQRGVREEEAVMMLKKFYSMENPFAPEYKKKKKRKKFEI